MKSFLVGSRGFTLFEMMAVLAIMALLVAVGVPTYQSYSENARASEIVLRFDALRTNVAADARNGIVEQCGDVAAAIDSANLGEDYASLSLGFEAVASSGYRPVMLVCARDDVHNASAVRIAHAALENLSAAHRVEAGAVVSDVMVSFAVPLAPEGQAVCRVPISGAAPTSCGGASSSGSAPSQAQTPAPAQTAAPVTPVVAVTTPPVVQPANPQPPEVLNALGLVPPARQQVVADLIDELSGNLNMVDSLGAALASGGALGMPGANFDTANQQCPGTDAFAGNDLYAGDCTQDFPGLCPGNPGAMCQIAMICSVSCGVTAPASPEVAAALREKHYAAVRAACYGSTISNTFIASDVHCQELTRLDAARAGN